MPLLRLKLVDLQPLSTPSAESLGREGGGLDDTADLEARIRRQFRFLPEGKMNLTKVRIKSPGSRSK
jgi:hypothetical protein